MHHNNLQYKPKAAVRNKIALTSSSQRCL